jgi:hypothetical protein
MGYQIRRVIDAGLADSSFLCEMEKAAIALARVDERLRRSEPLVQRGLLARTLYREAQGLVGLSGKLIHLVDLVLFDLDTNVQMSSDASALGRKYLAQLRRLARVNPPSLISAEEISEITGLPFVDVSTTTEDREADELDDAILAFEQLSSEANPQIGLWYKEVERLPVVLGALVLLDGWLWCEDSPKTEIGPLLCSGYLRAQQFTRLFPPVAQGLWNSKTRWERDAPPARRLLSLARNLERSACLAMADLDRTVLARASMNRHTEESSRSESLKALIDLFIEIPAVTTEVAAKRLSVSPQAVLQLMKRLGNARPPELTGRTRYRAWGVI